MVKEPRPGRVKTRLGRDIGMVPAAHWFRRQSLSLLHRLRDPRWQVILAVAPDREGMISRVWPADLTRVPQGNGDLGGRMRRLLQHGRPGPTLLIGADIPAINKGHIANAFAALGEHDSVFGPAQDGGFWLVGLKSGATTRKSLFQNVRWSTRHALSDSIATLPGHRIAAVETLCDVDTAADLAAQNSASGQQDLGKVVAGHGRNPA